MGGKSAIRFAEPQKKRRTRRRLSTAIQWSKTIISRQKMKMCSMETSELLSTFMQAIAENTKVSAHHISVYIALVDYKNRTGQQGAFTVFSREILPFAKLSRASTYHQIMGDLAQFGYIRYTPSHSWVLGSLVELL